jgi:hypothetical protein
MTIFRKTAENRIVSRKPAALSKPKNLKNLDNLENLENRLW